MKKCTKCGELKTLDEFARRSQVRGGHESQCKRCFNEYARTWRRDNKIRIKEANDAWHRANPGYKHTYRRRYLCDGRHMLAHARGRAKACGLPFDLIIGDITIPEYCPVLGLKLEFGDGSHSPASPSIDRIDNAKGYTRDNIAVVSYRANSIKRDATVDELRKIADYYEDLANAELSKAIDELVID